VIGVRYLRETLYDQQGRITDSRLYYTGAESSTDISARLGWDRDNHKGSLGLQADTYGTVIDNADLCLAPKRRISPYTGGWS